MNKDKEHGSERKQAEKPRWDNWHVRLPNPKDQQRAIDLFQRSGAQTKSDFVRGRILGESFKVIMVDKSAVTLQARIIHGGNVPKQTPQKGGYFNRINS